MTLEEVPPGQQPTSMTPTASSVGSWKTRHSTQAISGMMMNWDRMPVITAFGLVNTTLKSPSLSVMPMPNMTMPSSGLTQLVGSAACTGAGATKAMMATASAMMAIHLPAKSLIFSRTFMMNLSNVRALLGKRTVRRGPARAVLGLRYVRCPRNANEPRLDIRAGLEKLGQTRV